MKRRKKRCWKGYKPVKGKRPYSKGSCRKIRKNAKKLTADERWHLLKQSRDGYVKRAMIHLRTAKAMVRAGLPLRRSELRANPYIDPHRHHVRVKSPYRPTKWVLAEVGGMNQRCPYTEKPMSVSWQKIPGGYAPIAIKGWHKDTKRYPHEGTVIRGNPWGNPLSDLQILTQITNALKNLKKRNHNDEMIESVTMRRRPGYPTDYIIVVKHRYFVNGSRIYSAGLKTEDTIENFVRVIGKKTKRIGNSDYVFNIYGVRFPEAIKKKPGKLFDNRKR